VPDSFKAVACGDYCIFGSYNGINVEVLIDEACERSNIGMHASLGSFVKVKFSGPIE
jgi:hypothetical protein